MEFGVNCPGRQARELGEIFAKPVAAECYRQEHKD
jgi:hypothetical protein